MPKLAIVSGEFPHGVSIYETSGGRLINAIARRGEFTDFAFFNSTDPDIAVKLSLIPDLTCVLLLGEQALTCITGWSKLLDWHGSVMHRGDFAIQSPLCASTHVVACFSPFKHDPYRTFSGEIMRVIQLAFDISTGLPVTPLNPVIHQIKNLGELSAWVKSAEFTLSKTAVIDTEYGEDGVPYLVGVSSVDNPTVIKSISQPWMFLSDLQFLLNNADQLIMHHAPADVRALGKLGLNIPDRVKIIDTLQLHALIESAYPHRLSFVARTFVPFAHEWKYLGQSADNEVKVYYNALDVLYTGQAFLNMLDYAMKEDPGLLTVYNEEVEPNIIRMALIEDTGIRVDESIRDKLRTALINEAENAENAIQLAINPAVESRIVAMQREIASLDTKLEKFKQQVSDAVISRLTCGHVPNLSKTVSRKCASCLLAKQEFKDRMEAFSVLKKSRDTIRNKIKLLTNRGFNPRSDDDLRWYICSVLRATTGKRTDTGKVSVNVKALSNASRKFANDPVISAVWKSRHARKLISTFVEVACDSAGYTHPPVRMHGTATGRPASGTDKNGEEGKNGNELVYNAFNIPEDMRCIYVPAPGCVFINADFKDLEGRLMALFSGDETMCQLFREGRDRHSFLASQMYGCREDEAKTREIEVGGVRRTLRYMSKKIAHGIPYGMKEIGVASNLQITLDEAKRGYATFYKIFPKVRLYQQALLEHVFGNNNYGGKRLLHTIFGRRRRFNGLREIMENEAFAFPAQCGGASVWYRKVEELCCRNSLKLKLGYGRFVIGTYDSFVIEVPASHVTEACAWIKRVLESPIAKLSQTPGASLMPTSLPVDVKVGEEYSFGEGAKWFQDLTCR